MAKSAWQKWFERVWEYREEQLYPKLFGPVVRGIFPLSMDIFRDTFKQKKVDPRWLTFGVIEFAPTRRRRSWLYVTSGMSNAWEDKKPNPEGESGFGCEFVFETTEQGDWAILRLLHLMAFQILMVHGKYPGRESIGPEDRIPLRSPITPEPSEICWLILAPMETVAARHQLESGWFEFYTVFGATEAEVAFARERGGDQLIKRLKRRGAFPVTDPTRKSVIKQTTR